MARKLFPQPAATRGVVAKGSSWSVLQNAGHGQGTTVDCGTMTADVYKNIVTIDGSGWLDYLAFGNGSSQSVGTRTVRVQVDGVTAYEATSGALTTTSDYGVPLIGMGSSGSAPCGYASSIRFNSKLEIDLLSSTAIAGANANRIFYFARTE